MEGVEKLIDDHWEYVKGVLESYKEDLDIGEIAFHYKTAFLHGYKHGWDDAKIDGKD